MSKQILTSAEYSFNPNPSVRTITFLNIPNFQPKFLTGVMNVTRGSILYSPFPTGSQPSFLGTFAGNVLTLNSNVDTTGMNANDELQCFYDFSVITVLGQENQTAVINNILEPIAGTTPTAVSQYRFASVQVIITGTAGTFIFEGSTDGVNFAPIQVSNQGLLTGAVITTTITASASTIIYNVPLNVPFIRLRIASTITGGNIEAITTYYPETPHFLSQPVSNGTASNLAVSVASTTLSGSSNNVNATISNLPTSVADVASGTITATGSSSAITPAGNTYSAILNITAISGANASVQLIIEESLDNGTTWQVIYMSHRLNTTGQFQTPALKLRGTRIRYTWLVEGTSPSITRSIARLHKAYEDAFCYQVIDYAFDVTTTDETSRLLETNGNTSKLEAVIVCSSHGGTGGNPVIAIEGSMCRTNMAVAWTELQSITIDSAKAYYTGVINASMPFLRARVKTNAPTGTIIDYISLKAIA